MKDEKMCEDKECTCTCAGHKAVQVSSELVPCPACRGARVHTGCDGREFVCYACGGTGEVWQP